MSLIVLLEKDSKYRHFVIPVLEGSGWDFNQYIYNYSFDKPLKEPISFQISDYPNRIEQEFKVQILP